MLNPTATAASNKTTRAPVSFPEGLRPQAANDQARARRVCG